MIAKLRMVFAGLLALGLMSGVALADDKPTLDEAMALSKKGAALVAEKGLEEADKVFNTEGEFKHGEIYAFVIDFDGTWKIFPPKPTAVGQSVINLKDPDGKEIVKDLIAVAKDKSEGWVEYRWLNPASKKIEPKATYVTRIAGKDMFVGVGVYK